jgi:hypothetical protein
MWLCDTEGPTAAPDAQSLKAVVVGSGNYGSRSQNLDVESNCVVVFEDGKEGTLLDTKQQCIDDWNLLCDHSKEIADGAIKHPGAMNRIFFNAVKLFL